MTGSHEVRGSIPLGSTNHFNDLKQVEEINAVRLRQSCDNAAADTLTTPQSLRASLDPSHGYNASSGQSKHVPSTL